MITNILMLILYCSIGMMYALYRLCYVIIMRLFGKKPKVSLWKKFWNLPTYPLYH